MVLYAIETSAVTSCNLKVMAVQSSDILGKSMSLKHAVRIAKQSMNLGIRVRTVLC